MFGKSVQVRLGEHIVETFSFGYQDTPNSNALHRRETSDEMIRTLPYFSSLSLSHCFFPRQINRFLPHSHRSQIGASGLSMIERRGASSSFLPLYSLIMKWRPPNEQSSAMLTRSQCNAWIYGQVSLTFKYHWYEEAR